ncbi:agmatinase family protein [Flagellimonas hymeniacidonis]|uniref:Agmatinase family protein n=1 Tax=Flagellimonas hymeniacidonis TaxID=2603628 RepID=A0A5C8V4A5_9FLAO|nr:agmatinase family protein [Flagellimonas hymeniacidonis]TXN35815.1 agmatinase family protein [Flagellimonas hymeniacidonis]
MTKITLQGILYDEKSSFLKGPSLAPPLIREAYHSNSANYFSEDGTLINPELLDDKGDYTISEYFDIEKITTENLEERNPLLTFGGDHSITFPILKAFCEVHGQIDILHIDAHSDLYTSLDGDSFSHACPFYNIMKNKLASRLVQVGIRTLNSEQRENAKKYDVEIIEMKDFVTTKLPTFQNPIYLSLDMDALDPAFAPGVSHHEPGGLSTRQVIKMIQEINVPILGADIVEYNPKRDINNMTAMVCAKLFKEIVSKML